MGEHDISRNERSEASAKEEVGVDPRSHRPGAHLVASITADNVTGTEEALGICLLLLMWTQLCWLNAWRREFGYQIFCATIFFGQVKSREGMKMIQVGIFQ